MTTRIDTSFGKSCVSRMVGGCLLTGYVQTMPHAAAHHGEWWTHNPQRGYVPVPSNARGLAYALERETDQRAAEVA